MHTELRYPTLMRRYLSTLIDGWLLFLLLVLPGALPLDSEAIEIVRWSVFAVVLGLYEPILVATGCTLGQLLTGVRVRRDPEARARISIGRSLLRYVVKLLLFEVSLVTVLFEKRARALHDLAARSVMVRV